MMPKCRGCGAEIVWIETRGGKAMPCDPTEITVYETTAMLVPPGMERVKVVTELGVVLTGYTQAPPGQWTSSVGRIPHWATCTKRERFKK